EVRCGFLGAARLRMAIEEHGGGKQLVRFRAWPRVSSAGPTLSLLFFTLSGWAAYDKTWFPFSLLAGIALLFAFRTFWECAAGVSSLICAIGRFDREADSCQPTNMPI